MGCFHATQLYLERVKMTREEPCKNLKAADSFEFGWEDIETSRRNNRLLTFGMELSNICNLHCTYCYRDADQPSPNELSLDELFDAAKQAIGLGARKAGIVGAGEPTLDPRLLPLLSFLRRHLTKVTIFTNGTGITPKLAYELAELEIKVVVKINSVNPEVHDKLVGRKGAYEEMMRGLNSLVSAGYPSSSKRIEIESVITRVNIRDLPKLWRWCRDNGFTPFFERMTPKGRARESNLDVSPLQLLHLFRKLRRIDEEHYGYTWAVQPPFVAQRCLRHYYNCLIDIQGNVLPCSGLNIIVGNIRERSLAEILSSSPVIRDLRHIDEKIKGRCAECELKPNCYGCRGAAYQVTGDYLTEDPLCWHAYSVDGKRRLRDRNSSKP